MRFAALVMLFALMFTARLLKLGGTFDNPFATTMIGFGFLILAGMVAGEFAQRIMLPRITGYLLAGILCGPHVLQLVDRDVVANLKTIDDLALALIAFTAGGELKLDRLKRAGRAIAAVTTAQIIVAFSFAVIATIVASHLYDPFAALAFPSLIAAALFLGIIAATNSPAIAVAVIVDTGAKGPVSEQVISVTVLKDVIILILASFVLAIGGALHAPETAATAHSIAWVVLDTLISLATGAIFGGLAILYVRYIKREMVLFVVAASLIIVYESELFGLHFVLECIAAGFVVENFSNHGDELIKAVERTSMTVYVVFFALAGASIDFGILRHSWLIALAFVLVRALSLALGTRAGCALAGQPRFVRNYSWMGYLGQAGVSLGIASMIMRTYPDLGAVIYTIIVATVALNQIVGPIALKMLLIEARETIKERIKEPVASRKT